MILTLPEPPSSNRYWRVYRWHPVKSKEAREYQGLVHTTALAKGFRPKTGPLGLHIKWYRKEKRGDLSNRIKVVEDALQGVLYANDSQIVCLLAERHDDPKNPRVEIEVMEP